MMGSRVVAADPALSGMSLTQFLALAQDPRGFAAKLAEIQVLIDEMGRQQSTLQAAQTEHDARDAALVDRARELDKRAQAVLDREGLCVAAEAETGHRQQEHDTRAASLSTQSAALERRAQLIGEQRTALKQEVRRAAQAIDALKRSVDQEEHP